MSYLYSLQMLNINAETFALFDPVKVEKIEAP